uniref:Retrovirus-related Pol polyprotein from transposon 17.6 n=1 Tax=Cajanus cajan TaxID=3821 RepID=A0A151TFD7_CAJCA|nr:Retrovirus-related Pol polyprotein from transposon 17.6 [Cajanus cajan]
MFVDYINLNKACPKYTYPLSSIDRLVDGATGHRVNMEVYVDNMMVKSNSIVKHMDDLAEVFAKVKKYNMRLNLEKCVFGLSGGKFLGFMLTIRGIKANLDKCRVVLDM